LPEKQALKTAPSPVGLAMFWLLNPYGLVESTFIASALRIFGRATIFLQDGAPKIAKLSYKWLNYGLW
jgi:hypothetical protein